MLTAIYFPSTKSLFFVKKIDVCNFWQEHFQNYILHIQIVAFLQIWKLLYRVHTKLDYLKLCFIEVLDHAPTMNTSKKIVILKILWIIE